MDEFQKSMVAVLNDDSIMKWGKYEGKRLGDIPDSYFKWFLKLDWCDKYPDLVEYANHVE